MKNYKKMLVTMLAGVMLFSVAAAPTMAADAAEFEQSESVTLDVSKEKFHIYLCIGQSNMAGRASFETEDMMVLPNTYLMKADGSWEKAKPVALSGKEGVYEGLNRNSTVRDESKLSGLNPAFYFAKELGEKLPEDVAIGIVGNARGDTSIVQWAKGHDGSDGKTDYNLYEEALAQAKKAMEVGTLKGILWHHGCANAGTSGYTNKFKAIVDNFRTDLGIADLPVIMGEIPGFGKDANQINNRQTFNGDYIKKTAEDIENCWYTTSIGLEDIGDTTHFNSYSQRELGKRYANVVLDKIYNMGDIVDSSITDVACIRATNISNPKRAKDDSADIHKYMKTDAEFVYNEHYGAITAFPAEFVLDYGQNTRITQLDTYFADPYINIYRYKIYSKNEYSPQWKLECDNSSISKYSNVASDGALVDKLTTDARYIKIVITGAVTYKGETVESVDGLGVNEFVLHGGTTNVVYKEDFEELAVGNVLEETGNFASDKVTFTKNTSTTGKVDIETDNNSRYMVISKTDTTAKVDTRFNYNKAVADLDVYTVKFKAKFNGTTTSYAFNEAQSENKGAALNISNTTGNTRYYYSADNTNAVAVMYGTEDVWNEYMLVIRKTANTWDLYANGELINTGCSNKGSGTFGQLRFYIPRNGTGEIRIDDVVVMSGEPGEGVGLLVTSEDNVLEESYTKGTIKVKAMPTAKSSQKKLMFVVAEYDSNDRLVGVNTKYNGDGQKNAVLTMSVDAAEDNRIKIIVLEDLSKLKPAKEVTQLFAAAK